MPRRQSASSRIFADLAEVADTCWEVATTVASSVMTPIVALLHVSRGR